MNDSLSSEFSTRAPNTDDAAAVLELITVCDAQEYGEVDTTLDDVHAEWSRPGFELQTDAWLVIAPDGRMVGYTTLWDDGENVHVDPSSAVHPDYRGRGLEEFLLERAEAWAHERALAHSPARRVRLQYFVNANNPAKCARVERFGYGAVRHNWVMEIRMDAPPPAPKVPAGVVLRPFERGRDEPPVHACLEQAFRDMWGHVEMEYTAWVHWMIERPDWLPELSYLAVDGTEVAGATMCYDIPTGGWIRQLGVRRRWRQRGLGLALLYKIFGEYYARGITRVGLGVDAQSLTGATRLYERAGMKVVNHFARYQKELAV